MRPCDHFEPELSAFLDGELPAVEHGAVGAHVEGCAACARELDRLRAVGVVLRRWDADETRYATTNAFRSRVMSRLEPVATTPSRVRPGAPQARTNEPPVLRLLAARATAAAVVLVAAGAAVSLAWPERTGDDIERLEQMIASLRSDVPVRDVEPLPGGDATVSPFAISRLEELPPVVTPIEDIRGARSETVSAPERWEEHGTDRIVPDAFPEYDLFHRERRESELLEELRRARDMASAEVERPTSDDAPVTPLGRYLGSLQVAEGTYAHFQQVQVWPIVRSGDASTLEGVEAPLTADEALAVGVLRVREGEDALVIENRDRRGRSVLLLAGDVFHGGRHDRVAAEDVLLEPGQTRSVRALASGEQRRIARRTLPRSDGLAPHRVRALLASGAGQAALDRTVAASLPRLGVAGGDGSVASIFENDQLFSRADRYVRALLPRLERDRVVGFAVAAGGELLGIEIFSDHATLAAVQNRALRSYVVEALARPRLVGEPPERDVVVTALRLSGRAANSGTSGEVAAFLDPDAALAGYGLVTDGTVRHAVVFTNEHVDADRIAGGRLRNGFGDAPVSPDDLGGPNDAGTGPGRGTSETGGGLEGGR